MIIKKAYKFRLKTSSEIEQKIFQFARACRFIWNHCLAIQKDRLEKKEKVLSAFELNYLLPKMKTELPWLKDIHSQILQQRIKDLSQAIREGLQKNNTKMTDVVTKFFDIFIDKA